MTLNEMKLKISASSILAFQAFIGFTQGEVFVISRNGFYDRRDYVQAIPSSVCQNHGCKQFQAYRSPDGSCFCYCPLENATFVFHDNKWTCLDNGKVRELQGRAIMNGEAFCL